MSKRRLGESVKKSGRAKTAPDHWADAQQHHFQLIDGGVIKIVYGVILTKNSPGFFHSPDSKFFWE
jgi:hypothetical protein